MKGTEMQNNNTQAPVHISVVLDRSGSMSSIAYDIVGGFNEWLADQRKQQGEASVTLVQFDDDEPFEVLIDGVPLREVTDLERATFQPRGMTPLYDAVGRMVGRIDAGIARRHDLELDREDQVVVIITDGYENASREQTRKTVFDMIEERKQRGWVFVFLGANQDVYEAGEAMSISQGNLKSWAQTKAGTKQMFQDLSKSTSAHRSRTRKQRLASSEEFFTEDKSDEPSNG